MLIIACSFNRHYSEHPARIVHMICRKVRVNCDSWPLRSAQAHATNESTHVNQHLLVARPQVVENGALAEVGEIGHVLSQMKLLWIYLRRLLFFQRQLKVECFN